MVYQFIQSFKVRAKSHGWNNVGVISWVNIKYHQTVQYQKLLDNFGNYE